MSNAGYRIAHQAFSNRFTGFDIDGSDIPRLWEAPKITRYSAIVVGYHIHAEYDMPKVDSQLALVVPTPQVYPNYQSQQLPGWARSGPPRIVDSQQGDWQSLGSGEYDVWEEADGVVHSDY